MSNLMLILQIAIVILGIGVGARYGSIAIGMAGGLGVLLLGLTGTPVHFKDIPFDVIGIIMSVIAAIAAVQAAGGMTHLVYLTDKLLRKHPKQINFLGPIVAWLMTVCAGTGHTAFSILPVISEVAKENNVRPRDPLSLSVVSSQMAITASPISAAVVFMASIIEPLGPSYLQLLAIVIPATFLATILTSLLINFLGKPLSEDPVYQQRVKDGLIKPSDPNKSLFTNYTPKKGAIASLLIFLVAVILVMLYATYISGIKEPALPRNEAIMSIMLGAAMLTLIISKVKPEDVLTQSTFRSGMSACVCVLGVAWLGTTLVNAHIDEIKALSGELLQSYPWLLAVILFFAAALLYSQAATTKALMPAALAVGVSPLSAIAAFAAVSALFVLPTYPTLLAAVEFDDTGSTRIGKFVFNHPFMLPGVVNIVLAVLLSYAIGAVVL